MNEGDALLAMIRKYVAATVDPQHQQIVTDIVAHTVVTIMSKPQFVGKLSVVMELQYENSLLRQELARAQAFINRMTPAMPTPRKAPRKAVPRKAPVVKKAPAVRVKPRTRRPKI